MSDEASSKKVALHLTRSAAGLAQLFERLTGKPLSKDGQARIRKALERAAAKESPAQ
jgi:hypothetical protein